MKEKHATNIEEMITNHAERDKKDHFLLCVLVSFSQGSQLCRLGPDVANDKKEKKKESIEMKKYSTSSMIFPSLSFSER